MTRIACNFFDQEIPVMLHCIQERLWIRHGQRWWPPYEWAWKYHRSWKGLDWNHSLADPYVLIAQARQDIADGKTLSFPSQSGIRAIYPEQVPHERVLVALEKFSIRVDTYYNSGKDELLLKSIETGLWHFPK